MAICTHINTWGEKQLLHTSTEASTKDRRKSKANIFAAVVPSLQKKSTNTAIQLAQFYQEKQGPHNFNLRPI